MEPGAPVTDDCNVGPSLNQQFPEKRQRGRGKTDVNMEPRGMSVK